MEDGESLEDSDGLESVEVFEDCDDEDDAGWEKEVENLDPMEGSCHCIYCKFLSHSGESQE